VGEIAQTKSRSAVCKPIMILIKGLHNMGHRSIAWLISALFAFFASDVLALGLGKIKLESALNQPLNAEIELFEVRNLAEEEIRVKIASREDFERIGVDKIYFLSDFKFKVVLDGPGSPYVKVTSVKLVREPFLNFVLQVQWPSGKLLREYTLLMDLPAFSQEAPPVVQPSTPAVLADPSPAQRQPPSGATEYNPRSRYEGAPPRPSAAPVTPTYTEDTYRVQSNDTLWEIAEGVRPDSSVSIHQTMLALQRENPEAFIGSNINLLRAGQILRIPEREEISSMTQREALREVASQNSSWSGETEVADAQLSGTSVYDDYDTASTSREGRVKLTAPDDTYGSAEGRASGDSAASSIDALENELSITLEQLDKSSRENTELRSKIESLEQQIETMERMVEISDENLRALELSAKQSGETEATLGEAEIEGISSELSGQLASDTETGIEEGPGGTFDEEVSDDTSVLSEELESRSPGEGLTSDYQDEQVAGESFESAQEEATPTPTPQPDPMRVVSPPALPGKGIIDIILENVLFIAGGVIVLAGGAFFLLRQKSDDDEDFDEFMEQHGLEERHADVATDEEPIEDDIDLGDFSEQTDESPVEEEIQEDFDTVSESEAQTEDVVAEADIYIAYGKFDQAEEMLIKALGKDGRDEDVRLKLLEVYSTQGDAESFDPHYAKLRAFASPSSIDRAEMLRSNIPNVAEFDESSFDISDVTNMPTLDATEREAEVSLSVESEAAASEEDLDDLSLDLDLGDMDSDEGIDNGFELDLAGETAGNALDLPSGRAEEGALDLDLDLDLSETGDSLDLELDLPDDESHTLRADETVDVGDLSGDSDFDLEDSSGDELSGALSIDVDLPASGTNDADEFGDLDLELGDLDDSLSSSLDDDLAALDTEFELSDADAQEDDTVMRERPREVDEISSVNEDFDLAADLSKLDEVGLNPSVGSSEVSSDTVVNEALDDEYIEQKLSEETEGDLNIDDALPLEADAPGQTQALDALDIENEADLDLSSLDQELDALTSGLGDIETSSDADAGAMEEPITDFDDYEDDLEKNEAMAETVKSDHVADDNIDEMGEDTMFDQAINEVPAAESSDGEFELPEVNPDDIGDDDLDFLSDSDETATKLDLARAYIDMGDQEGAKDIIREVMGEGNDQQKAEAEGLLARINA